MYPTGNYHISPHDWIYIKCFSNDKDPHNFRNETVLKNVLAAMVDLLFFVLR